MDIKILVAAHKEYWMPEDELYMPIHVGAEGKFDDNGAPLDLGYVKDNTGDNISYKHRYYSDLSAVYWGWKNLDVDYMGSCHYRRYFVSRKAKKNEAALAEFRDETSPRFSVKSTGKKKQQN